LDNNSASKNVSGLPVLNHEQLAMLSELSDDGCNLVGELFEIFKTTTPAIVEELSTAIEIGNRKAAARLAHRLKGSAANLGAARFAAYCENLELRTKTDGSEIPESCRTELLEHLNECHLAVGQWLSAR
jgi:HPt (histidine-containing phosphotransfer) domain-containing protein